MQKNIGRDFFIGVDWTTIKAFSGISCRAYMDTTIANSI
jgi:hypothetical protein